MAPWSALLLSVLSIISEGLEPISLLMLGFVGADGVGNVCFLLILSGLNACLLNVSNFLVTSYTSAVTLQVLGNVKICLSIGISVAIFKNELLWEQAIGVVACWLACGITTSTAGQQNLYPWQCNRNGRNIAQGWGNLLLSLRVPKATATSRLRTFEMRDMVWYSSSCMLIGKRY